MKKPSGNKTVLCFGEVLWDVFPGGRKIGGAPLNVAYHLHRLGVNAAIVSRVGNDEFGNDINDFITKHGLHHPHIQMDTHHPTGAVTVSVAADHEVSYEIVREVAWDFIEYDKTLDDLTEKADYLVYGTLSTRSAASRNTLHRLLEKPLVKVLDVNLRTPFYSKDILQTLMAKAGIVKMNEAELQLIAAWFGCTGNDDEKMKALYEMFDLDILIVTRGANGACLFRHGSVFIAEGQPVDVADTVGSGDAFLAGFLAAHIAGRPLGKALEAANRMGALIAQKPGGCPEYDATEIPGMIL